MEVEYYDTNNLHEELFECLSYTSLNTVNFEVLCLTLNIVRISRHIQCHSKKRASTQGRPYVTMYFLLHGSHHTN